MYVVHHNTLSDSFQMAWVGYGYYGFNQNRIRIGYGYYFSKTGLDQIVKIHYQIISETH